MKILYVTDLDGTLLKSDDKMSEYTIETINNLNILLMKKRKW